jgi:hypothetical protein
MAVTIGRRELLAALASAAATWPLAAHAQQAAKLPTIGFLGAATPSTTSPWISAFAQRLRELGWIEGRKTMRFNEGYRVRPAKPPHTFDQHSGARRRSARRLPSSGWCSLGLPSRKLVAIIAPQSAMMFGGPRSDQDR